MPLIDNDLFGPRNKEKMAIELLKKHQPPDKPYWLAFSGGKDSVCILKLAELAKVKFESHYNDTTVDPPELKKFIKQHYSQVVIDRPEKSMFQLIIKKGPPMRQRRWCCEYLKERNPKHRIVVTGIRHEESAGRKKRSIYEQGRRQRTTWFLHPIANWSKLEVWEFIKKYELPYCPLYDEGFDRIGCVLCPMARNWEIEEKRWPKTVKAYRRAMRKFWDRKQQENSKAITRWENFEHFWKWWIGRDVKGINLNQSDLFYD
jgi:phosphoadenosine phosphosulfate reductase